MIRRCKIGLYDGEFSDILALIFSRKFSRGDYVREFENKFAKYIGVKHAITTYTGRSGMMFLFDALNLKKDDEVIFPAYTLKDLIILTQKKGLKPVLVDIERDSFNINPDLIEEKITNKTKVIIATHMFGLPCNMEKIIKIGKKYDVKIIEDCCTAHGAEFEGKKVGSFSTGGFFSFGLTKPISTFGGGMIVTNNHKIANSIRNKTKDLPYPKNGNLKKILLVYLENFILKSPLFYLFLPIFYFKATKMLFNRLSLYYHEKIRANYFQYTDIQAFVGLKQLRTLDKRNNVRIRNAKLLNELLDDSIKTQKTDSKFRHIYYQFIIKSNKDPEKIKRRLIVHGLDVSIKDEIYDDCTKMVKEFLDECPVTNEIFNSSLQIPIYESLTRKDIHRIAGILNEELVVYDNLIEN